MYEDVIFNCKIHGEQKVQINKLLGVLAECPICNKLKEKKRKLQLKKEKYIAKLKLKNIPSFYYKTNFKTFISSEEDNIEVVEKLKQSVKKLKNDIVFLFGDADVGKTHLLVSAVKAVKNAYYISTQKLLIEVEDAKNHFGKESFSSYIDRITNYPLLCIDDITEGSVSQLKIELFSAIIKIRYINNKTTWLAGNTTKVWQELTLSPAINRFIQHKVKNYTILPRYF
ncbi:MAG: ATP-binding protein [Treponema sp.]